MIKFVSAFFLALVCLYPIKSSASVPLMSLEEVRVLLEKGPVDAYFESVPIGGEIKRYNIRIRGIYEEVGLKLILFTINQKIVAGMSGSPVYVKGKLVGAMGYSVNRFNFKNPSWGGISSISSMLEDSRNAKNASGGNLARSFVHEGMLFEPISLGTDFLPGFDRKVSVSKRSFIASGQPSLKAGMPIVVDLYEVKDDKNEIITSSALGTITYIDDSGRIYAFGHPFLDAKKVVMSFRTCDIMGTVFSEAGSFKLSGKKSEVLGFIDYDSTYGISGRISPDKLSQLKHFSLELKRAGQVYKSFDIKISDSEFASVLASTALTDIGAFNGAPMAEESAVTEFKTETSLRGFDAIKTSELFSSVRVNFGLQVLKLSSYDVALRKFFDSVYTKLLRSPYGFKIDSVKVSANFIPGELKKLRLGAYKFPSKVKWGENPALDVLLVSEDNSIAIEKSIKLEIDWTKVEMPVYTKDTKETEKEQEKIITGNLALYNSAGRETILMLFGGEGSRYFLSAKDFLESFAKDISLSNQTLFYSVSARMKSGLFEAEAASSSDIISEEARKSDADWHIVSGGVRDRKTTLKNLGVIVYHFNLPLVPSGYVVDVAPEMVSFEIVLADK